MARGNFTTSNHWVTGVPLDREMDFIESYLELEKMRYGDELDVTLTTDVVRTQT